MRAFRRSRKQHGRHRLGSAVVEFALVCPLFLLLVFGIIEFGRMLMVQQVLTNATREGARRATVESATKTEVEQLVTNYLSNSSVYGATIKVQPGSLDSMGFGDQVVVSATIPYESVSWLPSPFFLQGTSMSASSTMQAERLQ